MRLFKDFVGVVRRIGYLVMKCTLPILKNSEFANLQKSLRQFWTLVPAALLKLAPSQQYLDQGLQQKELIELLNGINQDLTLKPQKLNIMPGKISEAFFNISQELDEAELDIITTTYNNICVFVMLEMPHQMNTVSSSMGRFS